MRKCRREATASTAASDPRREAHSRSARLPRLTHSPLTTRRAAPALRASLEVVRPGARAQPGDARTDRRHHRAGRRERGGQVHAPAPGERATQADARPRHASAASTPGTGARGGSSATARTSTRSTRTCPAGGSCGSMARLCGYTRARSRRGAPRRCWSASAWRDRADRKLRGYSKGMRQRIKLAQALLHDPELLILDEPLSGIDPIGRQELLELFQSLAAQGKCLLISSHELEELEKLTNHVAIMARGRIAAVGTLQQIRDLLDDHPLSVRIDVDRAARRRPAAARDARGARGGRRRRSGDAAGAGGEGPQPEAVLRGSSAGSWSRSNSTSAGSNRSTSRPTRSSATCWAARGGREIADCRFVIDDCPRVSLCESSACQLRRRSSISKSSIANLQSHHPRSAPGACWSCRASSGTGACGRWGGCRSGCSSLVVGWVAVVTASPAGWELAGSPGRAAGCRPTARTPSDSSRTTGTTAETRSRAERASPHEVPSPFNPVEGRLQIADPVRPARGPSVRAVPQATGAS